MNQQLVAACAFVSILLGIYQAVFDPWTRGLWAVAFCFDAIFLGLTFWRAFVILRPNVHRISPCASTRPPNAQAHVPWYTRTLDSVACRESAGPPINPPGDHSATVGNLLWSVGANLPVDYILLIAGTHPALLLAFVRLNRLARIIEVHVALQAHGRHLHNSPLRHHAAIFVLLVTLAVHSLACAWAAVACPRAHCVFSDAWVPLDANVSNAPSADWRPLMSWREGFAEWEPGLAPNITSDFALYTTSAYWAVATLSATGFGDVLAVTTGEKWLASIAMLVGVIMFGFIFGSLASFFAHRDGALANFVDRRHALDRYMAQNDVAIDIRTQVTNFYDFNWINRRGQTGLAIIKDLPLYLQQEVHASYAEPVWAATRALGATSAAFRRRLAMVTVPLVSLTGENIVEQNQMAQGIFYLSAGEAAVKDRDGHTCACFKAGALFGEIPTLLGLRNAATVVALTNSSLFTISKANLDSTLREFPLDWSRVLATARALVLASEACVKPRVPFDDATHVSVYESQSSMDSIPPSSLSNVTRVVRWALSAPRVHQETILAVLALLSCALTSYQFVFRTCSLTAFTVGYLVDLAYFVQSLALLWQSNRRWPQILCFTVDLPFDLLVFFVPSVSCHTVTTVRLVRGIRLHRLSALVCSSGLRAVTLEFSRRAALIAGVILVAVHTFACVHTLFSADEHSILASSAYVRATYWAASSLTQAGFGDVRQSSSKLQWTALCAVLVGQIVFGTTMALVASTLAHIQASKVQFGASLQASKTFLREKKTDLALQTRVETFFRMRWAVSSGTDASEPLTELPDSLRESVCLEQFGWALQAFPFFSDKGLPILRRLCGGGVLEMVPQNETIVHRLDAGQDLYFVISGVAQIWASDGHRVVCDLHRQAFFGEAGFFYGIPRLCTVRAKTNCKVLRLSRAHVERVLEPYPTWCLELKALSDNKQHRRAVEEAVVLSETYARPAEVLCPGSAHKIVAPATMVVAGIFHPMAAFSQAWETVLLLLGFILCFTISLQAAFFAQSRTFLVAHWLCELPFWLDIGVKFSTAFFASSGLLIVDRKQLRGQYAATNLALDLASVAPLELLVFLFPADSDRWMWLVVLRLNRLLRVVKFVLWLAYLERKSVQWSVVLQRCKFACIYAIAVHWVACTLQLAACFRGCSATSWRASSHLQGNDYILALYFAMNSFSVVGYGDIVAVNSLERLIVVFSMVFGTLLSGYIIGNLAASIANADFLRCRYRETLDAIKNYLKHHQVDAAICDRIERHAEHVWDRTAGADPQALFKHLPVVMQSDLYATIYATAINTVPLFQNKGQVFTRMLALVMKPLLLVKNELVVQKGDVGQEMYFISHGTVEVINDDGTVVFASMCDGEFFGEISLVFSCPRTASIRTATNCDLIVLTKQDLDRVLTVFPEIARQVRAEAHDRYTRVKQRAAAQSVVIAPSPDLLRPNFVRAAVAPPPLPLSPNGAAPVTADISTAPQTGAEVSDARTVCTSRIAFDPRSRLAHTFQVCVLVLSILQAFTVVFHVGFPDETIFAPILLAVFSVLFWLQIAVNFFMGLQQTTGDIITDLAVVRSLYLSGDFRWDLLSVLPFDLLYLCLWGLGGSARGLAPRVVAVLQLVHLIRLFRVPRYFSQREAELGTHLVGLRIIKLATLVALLTHCTACLWNLIGSATNHTAIANAAHGESAGAHSGVARYTDSAYWAISTLSSTGFGDITPRTNTGYLFAVFVMLVGKIMFGFIIGNITSTLANADHRQKSCQERFAAVQERLCSLAVHARVQQRVRRYFTELWALQQGADVLALFGALPASLRTDVCWSLGNAFFDRTPELAGLPRPCLRALAARLCPVLVVPGSHVLRADQPRPGLVFVVHGTTQTVDAALWDAGVIFGNTATFTATPELRDVVAVTVVEALLLADEDVRAVATQFPDLRKRFPEGLI